MYFSVNTNVGVIMMAKILLFFLLFFTIKLNAQHSRIVGVYNDFQSKEKPFRLIQIHRLETNSYVFYLELGRGAPDYNSGSLYGRLTYVKGKDYWEYLPKDSSLNCGLRIAYRNNEVIVTTINGDCGFGYGVSATGVYPRKNKSNPLYFIDRHGRKVYFDKVSPEAYKF